MGVGHIKSNETLEQANREALHWLIAFQEKPEDTDLPIRFRTWLDSSPENRTAWAEAQNLWNVLGEARVETSLQTMPPAVQRAGIHRRPQRRSMRFSARHFAASAAGVAAICLAVIFQPALGIWLAADYSTGTAEIRDIRLEDGSIVHLGADSAMEVAFSPEIRRVRLLSGQAYFEVNPDRDRPFQVKSGDVDTNVLGTAFDVRMMDDGVAVAVNRGRVGVASPDAGPELSAPLQAGDWVRVGRSGKVERGHDAPELAGGWRSGMLVVKDRPVLEVIDEIRRYHEGVIVFSGGGFGDRRVTGVYDLSKPAEALRAVALAHGARVRQIGAWVSVVSQD